MGAALIAIAVHRAEREIVDYFREAGAVNPDRAVPLPESDRPVGRRRLERLLGAQVVRPGARGGYWLDEAMYAGYRSDKRTIVLVVLGIAAATALGIFMAQSV